MYSNIECSKDHTECFIPEKTREKLSNAKKSILRIVYIGGVFFILSSLTACSGAKEVKKELLETTTRTETILKDNITKEYEIPTTQFSTTESTTILESTTMVQEETTKPPETTKVEQTTTQTQTTTQAPTIQKQTTTTNESTTQTNIITIEPTAKKYSKEEYNKLSAKLNKVLEKKDFPELAKKFITEGFYQIYTNYEEWHAVYKDLPTIHEYLDETIIPAINNCERYKNDK